MLTSGLKTNKHVDTDRSQTDLLPDSQIWHRIYVIHRKHDKICSRANDIILHVQILTASLTTKVLAHKLNNSYEWENKGRWKEWRCVYRTKAATKQLPHVTAWGALEGRHALTGDSALEVEFCSCESTWVFRINLDWQLLVTEQQSGQGLGLSNNSVLTALIIFQTYCRWNQ